MLCCYVECLWTPSDEMRLTAIFLNDEQQGAKNYKETSEAVRVMVRAVIINEVQLEKLPQDFVEFFPNLVSLDLQNCRLKRISRNDLKVFKNLREISIRETEIEEIKADVFIDLINIEVIELMDNKIKFIANNVFTHKSLKYVDLRGNPTINVIFATKNYKKLVLDNNYTRLFHMVQLNAIIDEIYHHGHSKLCNNVCEDLRKILISDKFRDFTIKIDETELKVHKFILIARSPTIADMIENNPEADSLVLQDIEVDVFKVVLDYIYNDSMPMNDEKLTQIFAAAGKLKLENLKSSIGAQLCDLIDENNALEMLKLATKQNHEELKQKSFEEIKKNFPSESLNDALINDVGMIQTLVDGKREFDENIRKAEENFKNLMSKVNSKLSN